MPESKQEKHHHQPPDNDPRPLVSLLIDHFGERAVSVAIYQAQKALDRGDEREADRWRWMADLTRETLNSDVSDVSGQHR